MALGTIRYGSNAKFREKGGYFMEEVRRDLIAQIRRDGRARPEQRLCRRPVGSHLDGPVMQDAAAEALREGLANFDGGRGWHDTKLTIDLTATGAAIVRRRARHRLSRLAQGGRVEQDRQ